MRGVWEELKFVRLALHFICLNCKLVCSWSQGICIWPLATLPGWLKIVYHHLPSTLGPSSASASASVPPLVFPEERDPKAAKGRQESLDGDRRIDRCIFVVFVFFVAGWLAKFVMWSRGTAQSLVNAFVRGNCRGFAGVLQAGIGSEMQWQTLGLEAAEKWQNGHVRKQNPQLARIIMILTLWLRQFYGVE